MRLSLEKIFKNSKFMIFLGISSASLFLFSGIHGLYIGGLEYGVVDFFDNASLALLIICLLIAFRKGEVNVQKTLIGALLFFLFFKTFDAAAHHIEKYVTNSENLWDMIRLLSFAGLELGIFISYIVLQTDHEGSSKAIVFSRVFIVILLIFEIIYLATQQISFNNIELFIDLAEVLLILLIVCIQTKVQLYKQARSEAIKTNEWTPEYKKRCKEIFKF